MIRPTRPPPAVEALERTFPFPLVGGGDLFETRSSHRSGRRPEVNSEKSTFSSIFSAQHLLGKIAGGNEASHLYESMTES